MEEVESTFEFIKSSRLMSGGLGTMAVAGVVEISAFVAGKNEIIWAGFALGVIGFLGLSVGIKQREKNNTC